MNTQAFMDITNEALVFVAAAYAVANKQNVDDQGHLFSALHQGFGDAMMERDPGLQVPVFKGMQNTLLNVFRNPAFNLNKAAILEVLPYWQKAFQHIFSERIKVPGFNIWHFVTPTMRMNDLVRILDTYITIRTGVDEPLEILLPDGEILRRLDIDCKIPIPEGIESKLDQTRADNDFFHICPFCESLNFNRRKDHVTDHMETHHYVYKDPAKFKKCLQSKNHIQRIKASVLLAVIKEERRVTNFCTQLLCAVKTSTAELQGRGAVQDDVPFIVEEGLDLPKVRKSKMSTELTKILVRDRDVSRSRDWDVEIWQEIQLAWAEAEKQGCGLFDWTRI